MRKEKLPVALLSAADKTEKLCGLSSDALEREKCPCEQSEMSLCERKSK